jgi:hypothetical protein
MMAGNRIYRALQPSPRDILNIENIHSNSEYVQRTIPKIKLSFCVQIARRYPFHEELGIEVIGLLNAE